MVIPGIAEISIRSAAPDLQRIHVTPMTLTGSGSKYPPTPDLLVQSKDDPRQFNGGLWIMFAGSWQVRMTVDGARGPGALSVPVPASSQKITAMDSLTGGILLALMLVLAAGVVGILAAAAGILWLGRGWWSAESADYAKSIYRPLTMQASVDQDRLVLQILPRNPTDRQAPDDFIEDHNHLMHLYAIREPAADAVFHIHPTRRSRGLFSSMLPAMPPGRYRLFADLVRANGFPETITTSIDLPAAPRGPSDSPDDAGALLPSTPLDGLQVKFDPPKSLRPGQPVILTFRVLDSDGNVAPNLRPYLGMPAHLAIFERDFSVFSHLHPYGNISMAAYLIAQTNLLPLNQNVLVSSHTNDASEAAAPAQFSFPFGFPKAGSYRAILQFATPKRVETVFFDIAVADLSN